MKPKAKSESDAVTEFSFNEDSPSYKIKRNRYGSYFQWEPLNCVHFEDEHRELALEIIAKLIYPYTHNKDEKLINNTRSAFVALASFVIENYLDEIAICFPEVEYPTLASVRRLTLGYGSNNNVSWFLKVLSEKKFISVKTRDMLVSMRSHDEHTLELIMTTVRSPAMHVLTLH
jgi:hypothetical protein